VQLFQRVTRCNTTLFCINHRCAIWISAIDCGPGLKTSTDSHQFNQRGVICRHERIIVCRLDPTKHKTIHLLPHLRACMPLIAAGSGHSHIDFKI
jgi:hypothetical protein